VPVGGLHLVVADHLLDSRLRRFLDLAGDELLEVVAFLIAFESRVEVALLRQASDWVFLPLRDVLMRDQQPIVVGIRQATVSPLVMIRIWLAVLCRSIAA